MSDYYDLFLAVDLAPEVPEPVLQELRWHLGLTDSEPDVHAATDWAVREGPWQVFGGGEASYGFDGADAAVLVQAADRVNVDGRAPWALTLRSCVHEDDFGIVMDVVAWLLRQATTDGWVGLVRSSATETSHHIIRHPGGFELIEMRPAGKWAQVSW
ncbi:hypothetical protein QFZ82_007451 [Streptomyces sp. V4I23]|uniref:hypothetical protein n=1 Tax=Streptomyces sp. V4I23 TaxID=3042282 RepID=UPI0027856D71|nr:hypothetical protein [Streptomyces sp. V4I23]MDQ1012966.1 hypothetical protein [Streptomyces sp. V4I23]